MNTRNNSSNGIVPGLAAVVLCGGGSTRIGLDKSQLVFRNKSMIQHVVDAVSSVCDPVVISAGAKAAPGDGLEDCRTVVDENLHVGPVEGLRVGLGAVADEASFAFVCGCDSPLIKPELIRYLLDQLDDYEAVVPTDGTHVFGTTAIYRTDLATRLGDVVNREKPRMMDLANHFRVKHVRLELLKPIDPELDSFVNINDRQDYFRLLRRFDEEIPSTIAMQFSSRHLIEDSSNE